MKFIRRHARWKDLESLDRIYTANMKPLVDRVARWDPDRFRRDFHPQERSVIEIGGKPAGFVNIVIREEDIYLAEIQLGEIYRRKGIGKELLQEAIALSESTGKRLWLRVVKGNPAKAFYEKFGFTCLRETDAHAYMERWPDHKNCAEC